MCAEERKVFLLCGVIWVVLVPSTYFLERSDDFRHSGVPQVLYSWNISRRYNTVYVQSGNLELVIRAISLMSISILSLRVFTRNSAVLYPLRNISGIYFFCTSTDIPFFSFLFRAIVYDCKHGPTTCNVLCY